MKAWTSYDLEGKQVIEEGTAEIAINSNIEQPAAKVKILPPAGTILNAVNEIKTFVQLCLNLSQANRQSAKKYSLTLRIRIFGIAMHHKGIRVSANIQAIYALSICGTPEIMNELVPLHKNYMGSCLYSHAKTRTQLDWILNSFLKDMAAEMRCAENHLQLSAHAIAVALRNDGNCPVPAEKREEILNTLIHGINSGKIRPDILIVCILAVGTMCDRRNYPSAFSESKLSEAENCINLIPEIYPVNVSYRVDRNCEVALKLIRGENLNEDEEKFLLTKLELDADTEI